MSSLSKNRLKHRYICWHHQRVMPNNYKYPGGSHKVKSNPLHQHTLHTRKSQYLELLSRRSSRRSVEHVTLPRSCHIRLSAFPTICLTLVRHRLHASCPPPALTHRSGLNKARSWPPLVHCLLRNIALSFSSVYRPYSKESQGHDLPDCEYHPMANVSPCLTTLCIYSAPIATGPSFMSDHTSSRMLCDFVLE